MALLQWTVGEARITRILETEATLPAQGLLPDASAEALAEHADWLKPHFLDDDNQFTLAIQGLVIESAGKTILVDTCVGEQEVPFDMADGSVFFAELAEAGFSRETIDIVLCTHLHFDHVGWNTMKEGDQWVPTFPNARYLFAEVEFDHWKTELAAGRGTEYAFTFPNCVQPVLDAGLADLVTMDHVLTDEVRLEATPGHTPGHVAVHIESQDAAALITGDLTHHPVQWAEPDWAMPADTDSKQAGATRRRLLDEHSDSALLVIGTHYAAPTAGYLVTQGNGHVFRTAKS
jgi:glyoxylase-like metal-dependent hydrolase (beta-lactamase superfamily II)